MNQSNLAYKLEPEEAFVSEAANAVSLAQLLRLNSRPEPSLKAVKCTYAKRALRRPVFRDNTSGNFSAFRVY